MRSWQFSQEPTLPTDTSNDNACGGGDGDGGRDGCHSCDDDDDSTFCLFGALFLNPDCTLEPP